jgi:large subunit ribosomal protein L5
MAKAKAAASPSPALRATSPARGEARVPNLARQYREKAVGALAKQFDYTNVMEVPRVSKVIVNIGIGEAKDNVRALESAVEDVRTITGQQPVVVKARKSVAAFKLRAGMPVGIRATLRGRRMWYFLEKLVTVALPRIRDFRGINPDGFDGRGNYSLGLREQIIFPEIDYDKIDKLRGLEVSIVTTAETDDEGRSLLVQLGMPFRKR